MQFDTFSSINSIIERDRTDTPYKYSLLKSVIESCQEYPHYAKESGDRVILPVGLCVVKWLLYYYPFFTPDKFIVMRRGEANGKHQIAFRPEFESVCRYYEEHGNISVFYDNITYGKVPEEIQETTVNLVSKIRFAIRDMPMRYLGYSQTGTEYSVFHLEEKPKPFSKKSPLSIQTIIEKSGTYSISKELYLVFRELGGFIIGSGCISDKWVSFLHNLNHTNGISDAELRERFAEEPVLERNTRTAREVYLSQAKEKHCSCVWSGKPITEDTLAVDHLIPFSVWKSNDLWNLVPADSKVNGKKSDMIPPRALLENRKKHIFVCWDFMFTNCQQEFTTGLITRLLGTEPGTDWKEQAFEKVCKISDHLINDRGYEEWK